MVADKPMKISEATKKALDDLKGHPRETYDDVVGRLVADALLLTAEEKKVRERKEKSDG